MILKGGLAIRTSLSSFTSFSAYSLSILSKNRIISKHNSFDLLIKHQCSPQKNNPPWGSVHHKNVHSHAQKKNIRAHCGSVPVTEDHSRRPALKYEKYARYDFHRGDLTEFHGGTIPEQLSGPLSSVSTSPLFFISPSEAFFDAQPSCSANICDTTHFVRTARRIFRCRGCQRCRSCSSLPPNRGGY